MRLQLDALHQQKQDFVNNKQAALTGERDNRKRMDDIDSEIVMKNSELSKQSAAANSDEFIEKMREAEGLVTKQVVDKVNKILENFSPVPLIEVLEHFVALLRNKAGTKDADVELFMKDHAKLIAKMARTTTNSCALSIVREAKEVMTEYSA